jgi:hypothetical protein
LQLCSSIGSVKMKRLPRPRALSTQIRPPCSSTKRLESLLAQKLVLIGEHDDGAFMEPRGRNRWQHLDVF